MKTTFAALAVSIAVAAIGTAPATAADMNGNGPGSLKDRGRSGTPVPAPMPYEEHYKYYIGLGMGWAFNSSGDISLTAGGGANPGFGDQGDLKGPFGVSLYAGRYITPSLRAEIGFDLRKERTRSRTIGYTATLSSLQDHGGGAGPEVVTNTYDMERTESVAVRNHTGMLNLYYDMNRGGRFNPYVGAGIGVSYMHFGRASSERIVDCEGSPHPTAPVVPQPCWTGTAPTIMPTTGAASYSSAQAGWGLAASLMAGMTYNISDRTHLDMGYRVIYQGGKALVASTSLGHNGFTGVSVMKIDSRIDHELRAGIRWDLW